MNIVKIKNFGGYLLELQLIYNLPVVTNGVTEYVKTVDKGSLLEGQDTIFKIPLSVDTTASGTGVYLKASVAMGLAVFEVRVTLTPLCFHVWGTAGVPFYKPIPCLDYVNPISK